MHLCNLLACFQSASIGGMRKKCPVEISIAHNVSKVQRIVLLTKFHGSIFYFNHKIIVYLH